MKMSYWQQVTVIVTHQLPLSKQKQSISSEATFNANPSFGNFVGSSVTKVVVEWGEKTCRGYNADVTLRNISKPSCRTPAPNKYSNIRNSNK